MIVGVPKEIKPDEYRVAMLPVGAEELSQAGHTVLIEAGAGQGSGIADASVQGCGGDDRGRCIRDLGRSRPRGQGQGAAALGVADVTARQVVFTYFHFAADEALTRAIIDSGITAIAYETLRDPRGGLPLLTPMSEVAGRMSIQEGAKYLERPQEGRGILLSGVPGVAPAEVAILGGGVVGSNAAKVAAGLGANVRILDINLDRLRYLDDIMPPNVTTLYSDRHTIIESIERADLVIGAILITGARAPRLVRRDDLGRMKNGAVIVDVAIDQGGCVATSRPTTHRAANLCRRRCRPLLRYQHARRRGSNQHLCTLQCHSAVCTATGKTWLAKPRRCRFWCRRRGQHRPGPRDKPGRGRDFRFTFPSARRATGISGRADCSGLTHVRDIRSPI